MSDDRGMDKEDVVYTHTHTYIHTYIYILGWPKSSFKSSVRCYRQTWRNFLANPYKGLLLSHEKEWNNTIESNMDGPRAYYTQWRKSDGETIHLPQYRCHHASPSHYFLSPEMLYLVFSWFSFFSLSFLLIEKINEDNFIYLFISSKEMFSEGKVDTIFAYTCPPTDTSKDVKIQILNTTSRTPTRRVLHDFPGSFCTIWVT